MKTLLAIGASLLLVCTGAHAATVGFFPASTSVSVGQAFSLDIMASFTGAESIDGGGLNLNFSPSIVDVTGVNVNTGLFEFFSTPGTIDNTTGNVTDITFNTFSNTPTGDFVIATVFFTANGSGASLLTLSESVNNPFTLFGAPVPVTFTTGSVVSVVPLPAAFWLLLSGSGVLGLIFRRRLRPD